MELTFIDSKPKDALVLIMCLNVEGFDIPHMDCILQECKNYPKFQYLQEEEALSDNTTPMNFQVYQKFARCKFHGLFGKGMKSCLSCEELPEKKTKEKFFLWENIWHVYKCN